MSEDYRGKICAVTCTDYENLVAEVERLKKENEETKQFWYEHCKQEKDFYKARIDELKESLKKCSPLDGRQTECVFCGGKMWEEPDHKPDCEYIKK